MTIYRITKKQYASKFNGKGAARYGNRWNSKGTEVIYCAESRALAFAELSVYLNIAMASTQYVMLTIKVPEKLKFKILDTKNLPTNWNVYPHIKDTQIIGDQFVQKGQFAIMKVPSAIVHGDYNFLLSPHHRNFNKIKIVNSASFPIDQRIFK